MHGRLSLIAFLLFLFYPLSVLAQGLTSKEVMRSRSNSELSGFDYPSNSVPNTDMLLSPSVSRRFYEIAYELAQSEDVEGPELEQAIVFLSTAMELDNNAVAVRPLLIELASRDIERDYSSLVYNLLLQYVDEFADLEIVQKGVNYLLERLSSIEEREQMLEQMMGALANNNTVLGSELATLLGILKAEKAELEAAEFYLVQAYKNNRYNKLAFAKLAELAPEQIEPALYLERLRLALRENPVDIEAAIAFAQRAEELQLYDTSAAAYEYCADLFAYLYPSEVLPARIYLPWSISCYNTRTNQSKCLQIAARVRQTGKFDLRMEAIAGRAALKVGDGQLATQIIQEAEDKAKKILMRNQKPGIDNPGELDDSNLQQVDAAQMAWFFCFIRPLPDGAVGWANKAFVAEQKSPAAASLLAYALVMNKEFESAKPLIKRYESNQISDLTLAIIQLAEGQNAQAIESLRAAIARDPGSFAAELAKEILARQGQKYIPPIDPDSILTALKNNFGQSLVPKFTPPEQIVACEFNIRGDNFTYGSDIEGVVAVVSNSSEPLVVNDNGLFKGNIRIDAEISGDLGKRIPNLISKRTRTTLLIEPGRRMLIPVSLVTGELRNTLLSHPQASLNLQFTVYLDPVKTDDGRIVNRLTYIAPVQVRVQRPGIQLTSDYLRNQFILISEGQTHQKIQAARLFTGLLIEQHIMSNRQLPYKFVYSDWMPKLLTDALSHESGLLLNPAEGQWVVKIHTMADMLPLPLEHKLIKAVAENLYDNKWPVRMMAVYLLAKNPHSGFDKVLDWVAKNDRNQSVRDMATLLGRSLPGQSPSYSAVPGGTNNEPLR
jgi:hypothetical protein